MESSIEILMSEHRTVEKALQLLVSFADRCKEQQNSEPKTLEEFVNYFKKFDLIHHSKEETCLFHKMEQAGFSTQFGPLGVMLMEHRRCRTYIEQLEELSQKASWEDQDFTLLAGTAKAYAQLLGEHIQKEDNALFPMAQQALQPKDWLEIKSAFDRTQKKLEEDSIPQTAEKLFEKLGNL